MLESLAVWPPTRTAADLGEPARAAQRFQADEIGCHVITVTPDLLAKLAWSARTSTEFSLETVQMFHDDAGRFGVLAASRSATHLFGARTITHG